MPLLPPELTLIGDIHSHVDGPAYTSFVDQRDEEHRPGLHLVVGRIQEEPPDFHCEVSIDGARFPVRNLDAVLAGYHRRRNEAPQAWLDKVSVKTWDSARRTLVTRCFVNSLTIPSEVARVEEPDAGENAEAKPNIQVNTEAENSRTPS